MKSWLKSLILKFLWFVGKSTRLHAINKSLLESNYLKLLENKKYKNEKHLINFGFKVYSQSDEDGIIEEIFNRIMI